MKIINSPLADVKIIESNPIVDHRGSFTRWFCMEQLKLILGARSLAQINNSHSITAGTVRGLHFQKPPHAEMKIVRCIRGRVWDVAVDLRAGSINFLKWYGEELSCDNGLMMAVPEGFAHGYQALEPNSELLYLNTDFYEPSYESAINPLDPAVAIGWPLPVVNLSSRDAAAPFITKDYQGVPL